jgi:hypothetical protein
MQIQLLASIPFFQFYLETGEKKRLLKLLNYKKVQINANVLCQIPTSWISQGKIPWIRKKQN